VHIRSRMPSHFRTVRTLDPSALCGVTWAAAKMTTQVIRTHLPAAERASHTFLWMGSQLPVTKVTSVKGYSRILNVLTRVRWEEWKVSYGTARFGAMRWHSD
jgi:hypothetical protein